MTTLLLFVIAYIICSIAIGLYASLRVHNTADYLVAGRSLPIYITIATVFATWFGSEAVLGIPATFIEEGLGGVVADPFGAGFCLIIVGVFFAAKLYRMKLLTIGDFYHRRYGRSVEVMVAIAICISYLGWVAAQVVALGMVIDLVSGDLLPTEWSMLVGLAVVMLYTIFGGMWSVVITDFVQMIVILVGLVAVAFVVADRMDGGATAIIQHAADNGKFEFWPEWDLRAILAFVGAFITLGLGSIPQQDVFQRVMSAKDEKVAARGTIIGGSFYILFCFIPVFIIYGVTLLRPDMYELHSAEGADIQRLLPDFILQDVPLVIQVLFFGALMSAIMSTASGTLLAPSAILAENIFKESLHLKGDKALLRLSRICVVVFGCIVYAYAYFSTVSGLSIFEMVENAYLVTLCGAFVPLAFGVYWKKANNVGAIASIVLGVSSWASLEVVSLFFVEDPLLVPPQLVGLIFAVIGMVGGSLLAPAHHKAKHIAA